MSLPAPGRPAAGGGERLSGLPAARPETDCAVGGFWARSRGCTEMASDTELTNRVSEAAHLRLGYRIAAKVMAFRKRLT